MIITIEHQTTKRRYDLSQGIDISIPIHRHGPRAWYVPEARISPVINQYFTGSTRLGGRVNFNNVAFNPHGHGTHTETVGHIASESHPISTGLQGFHHFAKLITVEPAAVAGDRVIQLHQIQAQLQHTMPNALIIRTLPNDADKTTRQYSNTNFPYMTAEATAWLASMGVEHLLVDLPSIDREEDGGELLAHHAFWQYPQNTRRGCTISEMIFVPNEITDGEYLLLLAPASFANDAAPSRVVLYRPLD